MTSFGSRLKELRESKGITAEKLSETLGVAKSVMWNYEADRKDPSFLHLKMIAEYFNVSLDYLVFNKKAAVDLSSSDSFNSCCKIFLDGTALNEDEHEELLVYLRTRRTIKTMRRDK